jgi:hypothetical protein
VNFAIGRSSREALYSALVTELSGVGDIAVHLNANEAAQAMQLRARYEQDMRLLDDLGWEQDPAGERFDITMPRAELRSTLERLYWSSAATLAFVCEVDPEYARQTRETQRTCSELLAGLVGRTGADP